MMLGWRPLPGIRLAGMAGLALLAGLGAVPRAASAADARLPVVALALGGDRAGALRAVERALKTEPEAAHAAGFSYLRGRLLDQLGRLPEAAGAYAEAMGSEPALREHARFRLAEAEARLGHPEVAAGLAATLLGEPAPASLLAPATRLLRQSLSKGGDCRLLRGLDLKRLPAWERRQMQLVSADCQSRARGAGGPNPRGAPELLLALLDEDRADNAALDAAHRIAAVTDFTRDGRTSRLLGLAFHSHREFTRSTPHLQSALAAAAFERLSSAAEYDLRYALARNHFWEGRYPAAASAFRELAAGTADPARRSQALYQQARSHELAAEDAAAARTFLAAYQAQPRGENAPVALFALARLEFLAQREQAAFDALRALGGVPAWRATTGRAALFFATSDLVQGRSDRAGAWLSQAAAAGADKSEVAYWRGRWAEAQGASTSAVQHYLEALRADPFHPLAVSARARLASSALVGPARALGLRLASGKSIRELYGSWLLLGSQHPRGGAAIAAVLGFLRADALAAPFLNVAPVPPQEWRLWRAALTQPEERLLALGLFDEGAAAVLRHFPASNPRLALTGAAELARAGEPNRALYVAEVVAQRVPARLPADLLPWEFRKLLYPLPWADLIAGQASLRKVDPHLLAAILREESRFDRRALSAASARGLAQFVLPTARRLAPSIGVGNLQPADLERPEISIALAAAYLADLDRELGGAAAATVVAYNAGEAQARLWRRYCRSAEPEELFSKITFKETRAYLTRVLRSRQQYAELYAARAPAITRTPPGTD